MATSSEHSDTEAAGAFWSPASKTTGPSTTCQHRSAEPPAIAPIYAPRQPPYLAEPGSRRHAQSGAQIEQPGELQG